MRKWRQDQYGDAFAKIDRTFRIESKVLAAKRRKRDDGGKFNLEPEMLAAPVASEEDPISVCATDSAMDLAIESSISHDILKPSEDVISVVERDHLTWHHDEHEDCQCHETSFIPSA